MSFELSGNMHEQAVYIDVLEDMTETLRLHHQPYFEVMSLAGMEPAITIEGQDAKGITDPASKEAIHQHVDSVYGDFFKESGMWWLRTLYEESDGRQITELLTIVQERMLTVGHSHVSYAFDIPETDTALSVRKSMLGTEQGDFTASMLMMTIQDAEIETILCMNRYRTETNSENFAAINKRSIVALKQFEQMHDFLESLQDESTWMALVSMSEAVAKGEDATDICKEIVESYAGTPHESIIQGYIGSVFDYGVQQRAQRQMLSMMPDLSKPTMEDFQLFSSALSSLLRPKS